MAKIKEVMSKERQRALILGPALGYTQAPPADVSLRRRSSINN